MLIIKLTDKHDRTRPGKPEELTWGEGITHTATGVGGEPCSTAYIHGYLTPELAGFGNPIHGEYKNPHGWLAEMDVMDTDGMKVWGKSCTTLRRVDMPEITTIQRVEIAIRTAMVFCDESHWCKWAQNWLDGTDRSTEAALTTRGAAVRAAEAEAAQAAAAAADAAGYAAKVARAGAEEVEMYTPALLVASYALKAARAGSGIAFAVGLQILIKKVISCSG